ncbi:putative membrane protein [Microvirga flocculans]|uniref:Putative membrane protein n=1 Tax=Microvirga flocculans TaxID=217168 RepID=A0A7W6N7C2_9HYPH|nr:hypothetical protein [Microvirga flocculans]MBB4039958.1 putative membrane protein [Microvirga flocculans]
MTDRSLRLGRISLAACLALLAASAQALGQSHPMTLRMACAQARALVATQGAIVLSTSPFTYDRYVGAYGYCALGEIATPAWVPTADVAECPVGYRCLGRNVPSRN